MTFLYGVNIHGTYPIPFTQSLDLAKSLGLKLFRVDVYDATTATKSALSSLLTAATSRGMTVMPVLVPNISSFASETAAYNACKTMAQSLAASFPSITYWECGNEEDEQCILSGHDGTLVTDYDPNKYVIVRGAIRGYIAGVKGTLPAAKTLVGMAGVHFPFLNQLWRVDGLRWDITSEHYYMPYGSTISQSDSDGLFSQLAQWGKPIMMTEFNQINGHQVSPADAVIVNMMTVMKGSAARYGVIGWCIYELLDQPELIPTIPTEAYYGLASATGVVNSTGAAVQNWIASN